jgi:hypothetical protein
MIFSKICILFSLNKKYVFFKQKIYVFANFIYYFFQNMHLVFRKNEEENIMKHVL